MRHRAIRTSLASTQANRPWRRPRVSAALAVAALVIAVWSVGASSVAAQGWLADRDSTQGPGFEVGALTIHPGFGMEFGWDSNVYLEGLAPEDRFLMRLTAHLNASTRQAEENPRVMFSGRRQRELLPLLRCERPRQRRCRCKSGPPHPARGLGLVPPRVGRAPHDSPLRRRPPQPSLWAGPQRDGRRAPLPDRRGRLQGFRRVSPRDRLLRGFRVRLRGEPLPRHPDRASTGRSSRTRASCTKGRSRA